MSDQNSKVLPFNSGHKIYLGISPVELYAEGQQQGMSSKARRSKFMRYMHGMLETSRFLQDDRGIIEITNLSDGFIESEKLWGGDGIRLEISSAYSAAQFSERIGDQWVVYDFGNHKYFLSGVEQSFEQMKKGFELKI